MLKAKYSRISVCMF